MIRAVMISFAFNLNNIAGKYASMIKQYDDYIESRGDDIVMQVVINNDCILFNVAMMDLNTDKLDWWICPHSSLPIKYTIV